ncbi:hypothetical protein TIFTF001_010050 [Ficus carica]|uniref:R13L1/DRL21-like LRR repeat region domain-containing protein n=1 Tax=Ficus carica TaxID=3494 RepID=A0AA87ZR30_FICCA|nr:hypothetical protein TIFTF001_010050 [Ficus carica]
MLSFLAITEYNCGHTKCSVLADFPGITQCCESDMEILPESVCFLNHLLTLDLSCCRSLHKLPNQMSRLKCLRHLYIHGSLRMRDVQRKLTLPICPGKGISQNWSCLGVQMITNLRAMPNREILENVVEITLSNCKNCSELPPLGKLKSLRDLRISGMNFVRYMDNESYNGDLRRAFSCLKTLRLEDLPNLERLSREEGKEMFPCLSSLHVDKCPKLALPDLGSLKNLVVFECSELLLKSISSLPGLTHLCIIGNDQLAFFPERALQNLTLLQKLEIFGFTKLQELPPDMLIELRSLEDLRISFCHELRCLPERIPFRGPTLLKRMTIKSCKKLKSLSDSFQDLTALRSLDLVDCPELEGFPSCLDQLSSLQSLTMSGLKLNMSKHGGHSCILLASHKLAALPEVLQQLRSLEVMEISYFLELSSLPDWLGNLASLRELSITDILDHFRQQRILRRDSPHIHKRQTFILSFESISGRGDDHYSEVADFVDSDHCSCNLQQVLLVLAPSILLQVMEVPTYVVCCV